LDRCRVVVAWDDEAMNLNEYQNGTAATAIYPRHDTLVALTYLGLGLASEAGEAAGLLKKVIRDRKGELAPEDVSALVFELGDVLWYVARLAAEFGASLDDVARLNLDKLADRAARGVIGGSGDHR